MNFPGSAATISGSATTFPRLKAAIFWLGGYFSYLDFDLFWLAAGLSVWASFFPISGDFFWFCVGFSWLSGTFTGLGGLLMVRR